MGTHQSVPIAVNAQSKKDDKQLKLIVEMKQLLILILKEFKAQDEDVSIFEAEMKTRVPGLKRGENFEARLDDNGNITGIAKIFNIKNDSCSIYFGGIDKKLPVGRGINIKVSLSYNKEQNVYTVITTTYQAHLMQSWSPNQQGLIKGCLIKKKDKTIQFFKGQFRDQKIYRGKLILKQNDTIKMVYVGQFLNSLLHGRGVLTIPGKYKYTGQFIKGHKQGIGQQEDQLRKTYYVGQFQANNRHGYGELTYKNRDNVKLKGFWNDGIMRPDEGMYVSKDGIFLEKLGNDINLI